MTRDMDWVTAGRGVEKMEVDKSLITRVLARELPELVDPERDNPLEQAAKLTDRILRGAIGSSPRGRYDAGGRLDVAFVIRDVLWPKCRNDGMNPNDAENRAWEVARVVIDVLVGRAA